MSEPRKAYFVVPPTGKFIREDRCQTPIKDLKTVALRPPIDLLYCAAAFEKAGVSDCRLMDYPGEERTWDDFRRDVAEFQPDFIVLSITTPSLDDDLKAAAIVKEVAPDALVIAKGAHFNVRDVQTLERYPSLDLVFRGEYEETAMELVHLSDLSQIKGITWRDKDGKIHKNPDRGYIENLDEIPFPARHLANNDLYLRPDTGELQTTIVTNRGCPFSCIYCLAPQVGGSRNRYRSVENVIAEIEECIDKYNIRNFLFRSDLFTQNKRWVKRLCQAIIDRNLDIKWACNSRVDTIREDVLEMMQRAHCWLIAFGVESGLEETLKKIDKRATAEQARKAIAMTKATGIYTSVYMLMGLPWESEEDIQRNTDFFIELDADFYEIFYVYPFPGTKMHDIMVENGLLKPDEIPEEAYGEPAVPSLSMSREELAHLRRRSLRRLYMRPSYVWKTLRKSKSPAELLQYVKYGAIQLKDFMVGA